MAPSAVQFESAPEANGFKPCPKHGNTDGAVHRFPAPLEAEFAAQLNKAAEAASRLSADYNIIEQPIGTRRPIRVACMGAGYSGLMMAIVFSQQMQGKNAELVVYERNEDLGGTWLENRYGWNHPSNGPFRDSD